MEGTEKTGGSSLNPSHSCGTKLSTLRVLSYDKRTKWKAATDRKNNEWLFCESCRIPVLVEIKISPSKTFPDPKPKYTNKEGQP